MEKHEVWRPFSFVRKVQYWKKMCFMIFIIVKMMSILSYLYLYCNYSCCCYCSYSSETFVLFPSNHADRKQICHLVTEIVHELSEMVQSLWQCWESLSCVCLRIMWTSEKILSAGFGAGNVCAECAQRTDVWETRRFNKTVIYIHTIFVERWLANSSLFAVSRSTMRNTGRVESFFFLQTSLQSFISSL